MPALIIAILPTLLGIIATVVAWKLNPKRIIYTELDSIYRELEKLYGRRDKALLGNDTDELTIVNSLIIKLIERKNTLLARLK